MRRKPLSPSFFSHSNYSRLLLILLPLLIAVTLVSAAVFVYYPVSINANWVNPPVTFFNPETPGVTVSLYDDNTRAEVDVTSPGVLTRVERYAFVWDDYSDNPFTEGRMSRNGGWDWNSAGYIEISIDGQSSDYGGMWVAYYSTTIPNGTSVVYVLAKEWHDTSASDQRIALIMINNDTNLYTFGYRYRTPSPQIEIRRLQNGKWNTRSFSSLNLIDNTWRIFMGRRVVSGTGAGGMSFTVYDISGNQLGATSTTDISFTVSLFGVGIRDNPRPDGNRLAARFDDFIACRDADPSFVNVIGLMQGWTVYLIDSGGNTVASATAGSNGVASLNVLTRPIVRNARFEIRWNGIVILPSQSFPEVVGGDVYSCNIRDMNILGFQNQDNKAYNVYLKLEGIQVPQGYSGSINLWLGAGFGSTPIRIVGNVVYQDTTSTITLGSGAPNYIHGTFSLSPSTSVVLTLSFHYYLDGVEVEYPVTVRVHS
jgi:hypothetical protein